MNRWYVGCMNDARFIIDTPPRPSTDDAWHERPDGPSMVLNVVALAPEHAQAIVDAHNAVLPTPDAARDRLLFLLRKATDGGMTDYTEAENEPICGFCGYTVADCNNGVRDSDDATTDPCHGIEARALLAQADAATGKAEGRIRSR